MRRLLISWILLFAPIFASAAEPIPPSPIVKATLTVHAPSIKPGMPIDAGVTFTMPEHWHIYWQNPGDSGLPTSLEWALPEGLKAGDIEWPVPERLPYSGLFNYGYSNHITLPVKLTPMRGGIRGDIRVKASWLVCRDICIPESATLTAPIAANNAGAKAIKEARSRVPQAFVGSATFDASAESVTLTFTRDAPWETYDAVNFYPVDDGIITNSPTTVVKQVGNELTIAGPRGTADLVQELRGVLQVKADGKETAWGVKAVTSHQSPVISSEADSGEESSPLAPPLTTHYSLLTALLLAFLGGIILNIMPCVLPILALKALALSKKAQASRAAAAQQGLSYTAGVVISFMMIAFVMLALKASGSVIGWGFQLQNAGFVAFLMTVMLLVSANLLGMFELPVLFGEKATAVDDSNPRGSFFTGVLAVLVATPCTAPFMATAIGATLAMPPVQAIAVFMSLGFGMASPFLLISIWPAARRLLPKPGA